MMSPARFAIILILLFFLALCSVSDRESTPEPVVTQRQKDASCDYLMIAADNHLVVKSDRDLWINGERWKRVTYENKRVLAAAAGMCLGRRVYLRDHLSGAELAVGRANGDPTIY